MPSQRDCNGRGRTKPRTGFADSKSAESTSRFAHPSFDQSLRNQIACAGASIALTGGIFESSIDKVARPQGFLGRYTIAVAGRRRRIEHRSDR